MIATNYLLYSLDLKLNKVATLEHQSIPLTDKLIALNEAQNRLVKSKLGGNNISGLGLDGFKKRYEDLQILVVPFEELSVSATSEIFSSYQADLTQLTNEYMLPIDAYTLCTKGDCTEHPVVLFRFIKHGDLSVLINNEHYKPSFEYQETFGLISNNKLIVYTDDTFAVDKVFISYLRYPRKIDYTGYIDLDDNASTTQDCELPEFLADELLDLAVLELAMDTENTPVVQFSNIRNKHSE